MEKTHQFNPVPIEVANFLEELVQEMSAQNNRGTQDVWFMVYSHKREMVREEDDRDERERKDFDYEWDLCEKCQKLYDEDDDLPASCEECCSWAWDYYKRERVIDDRAWVFLTAKACEAHIEQNRHHYGPDAVSYGIHFRRNSEMVKLINAIFAITGKPMPNNYSQYLPINNHGQL